MFFMRFWSVPQQSAVRWQLDESQNLMQETVGRLHLSYEGNETIMRQQDKLKECVTALEAEDKELLEKIIHDDQTSNVDIAESTAEIKVYLGCHTLGQMLIPWPRTSLRRNTSPGSRHTLARCTI
jgi:hypothetical protein